MVFKIPKSLERTVLGIASALIIAATPAYLNSAERQTEMLNKYSVYLSKINQYSQKGYEIPVGKRDKKRILLEAKKGKNPASLEIIFGVDEPKVVSEKRVAPINRTPIDPGFSRFVILHPKKVKINEIIQDAYVLPEEKFVKLVSLKKSPSRKTILESGEDVLDSVTSFFPGINPLKSAKNRIIESSSTKKEEDYFTKVKALEKEFGEEYTFEEIEFFQQKGLTDKVEVARKIKTYFETKELEGTAYVRAQLKPSIGNSSTPLRGIGEWIDIDFLISGEKIPFWVKKQEVVTENINGLKSIEALLKKKNTIDIGTYDPFQKRAIVYSFNQKDLGKSVNDKKTQINTIGLFLGIEKDLQREDFSDKTIILLEEKNQIQQWTYDKFKKECRRIENK